MKFDIQKLTSYVGFARRSKNLLLGADSITASKQVKVILVSGELSESSFKKLQAAAEKRGINCFVLTGEELFKITGQPKVKALGITEPNLAGAITKIFTN